jgi:hypothetical protein
MEQRTDEWKKARCGLVGCSRLSDVLASGRSGSPSATRKNYMAELLCEQLTGISAEHFTSSAMQWGIDTEPMARAAYEATRGEFIEEVGGKKHGEISGWWGSPDGLIGRDGGIEIKCPNTATHLDSLLYGKINSDYIYQMAGYVEIYERNWWDFVSYDPRLPEKYSMFVKRFTKKELPIHEVKDGVIKFIAELSEMKKKLEAL